MEPENIVGKYAVAVIKKNKVVEHLMNDKSGKFVKTVFFTWEPMKSTNRTDNHRQTYKRW